ncbi:methyltransferase domain-containing protein [Candidatus Fermentibacteria bacterium]|nr:methyltransferase domain-containing protein [Candidatus Fermentibacteria bacterium]
MKDTTDFYEEYWRQREREGRLHILDGMWTHDRITIAVRMIQQTLPETRDISVLDIGCGEGALGEVLKASWGNKLELVGVDISSTALRHARNHYDDTICVNVESQELSHIFKNRHFEYVVCLETLEHLFEPAKLLQQFAVLLKPEGYLIASFPNIAWWRYRLDLLQGKFPQGYVLSHPNEHIQNFTLGSFYELLKGNGFEPVMLNGKFALPWIFRPQRFFVQILRRFPSLFGYQLVVLAKASQNIEGNP